MVDIIDTLSTELSTDPLTRNYAGMTDAQVAASINAVDRENPAPFSAVVDYLVANRSHTNQGQDTAANNVTPSTILGRLVHAAEQNVLETALPVDVFGAGSTPADKRITNTRQLHSCKAFLEMLRIGHLSESLFTASAQGDILNDIVNAGVMNTANRTALIALSENQISRATELGLPVIVEAQVAEARA